MSDINRFLEFYASLALDGETPLIVRQKPLRPLAYHADGNPKCTYIAMLPGARIDPSWSVYGNTGSFIIDRFPEGRPVAQARCVDYPIALMMVMPPMDSNLTANCVRIKSRLWPLSCGI
jgi:hypothetical protein